jgi:hypothetical protein
MPAPLNGGDAPLAANRALNAYSFQFSFLHAATLALSRGTVPTIEDALLPGPDMKRLTPTPFLIAQQNGRSPNRVSFASCALGSHGSFAVAKLRGRPIARQSSG